MELLGSLDVLAADTETVSVSFVALTEAARKSFVNRKMPVKFKCQS